MAEKFNSKALTWIEVRDETGAMEVLPRLQIEQNLATPKGIFERYHDLQTLVNKFADNIEKEMQKIGFKIVKGIVSNVSGYQFIIYQKFGKGRMELQPGINISKKVPNYVFRGTPSKSKSSIKHQNN